MEMNKLFIEAAKNKVRFNFRGVLSVEDLFDLSVQNLDSIFKSLNAEVKQVQEESLLNIKTKEDKELEMKIEIVKYIFGVKTEENNARLKSKELKDQEQKILEALEKKRNENLYDSSEEELEAMLAAVRNQK